MTLGQLVVQLAPGEDAKVVIRKKAPDGGTEVISGDLFQGDIIRYFEEEALLESWVGGVLRVSI